MPSLRLPEATSSISVSTLVVEGAIDELPLPTTQPLDLEVGVRTQGIVARIGAFIVASCLCWTALHDLPLLDWIWLHARLHARCRCAMTQEEM